MKITKWNYTLTHKTRTDEYGFIRDVLEIQSELWVIYPIVPHMKVKNYSKENNVLDSTMWYTEKDLEGILEDFVQELNK